MALNPAFVNVSGQLEPAAIACAIARDTYERLGELVACTIEWLDEQDNPLDQKPGDRAHGDRVVHLRRARAEGLRDHS